MYKSAGNGRLIFVNRDPGPFFDVVTINRSPVRSPAGAPFISCMVLYPGTTRTLVSEIYGTIAEVYTKPGPETRK